MSSTASATGPPMSRRVWMQVAAVVQARERVALGLVAQQLHLDPRALEPELQLGQLAHRGALDLDAALQHVVGLLGAAGLAQGGSDRAQDHAARLRHAVAEPLERVLAGGEHVVDRCSAVSTWTLTSTAMPSR